MILSSNPELTPIYRDCYFKIRNRLYQPRYNYAKYSVITDCYWLPGPSPICLLVDNYIEQLCIDAACCAVYYTTPTSSGAFSVVDIPKFNKIYQLICTQK